MEKEIKINCPEGYEIDKENSTFECIKFKPIEKQLPKTWEEYCKTHPRRKGEAWYDDTDSEINVIDEHSSIINSSRSIEGDVNLFPNRKYAEAMLALCQLIQLRDCYNDGWVPDYTQDCPIKYCIEVNGNKIHINVFSTTSRVLTFKTKELRDKFLINFRDLIEVAKPLL